MKTKANFSNSVVKSITSCIVSKKMKQGSKACHQSKQVSKSSNQEEQVQQAKHSCATLGEQRLQSYS